MTKKKILTVMVINVVLASGVVGSLSANASTGTGVLPTDSSVRAPGISADEQSNLDRLRPLASDLTALVDPLESGFPVPIEGKPSGYVTHTINRFTGAFDLYWSGPVPTEVQELIARYPQVSVTYHEAKYSRVDLAKINADVFNYLNDQYPFGRAVHVAEFSVRIDGSGLRGTLNNSDPESNLDSTEASGKLTKWAGVPVTAEVWKSSHYGTEGQSRQTDSAPWYGGAGMQIHYPSGVIGPNLYCSSAIGITTNSTGNHYLLTAGHCLNGFASGETGKVNRGNDAVSLGTWKQQSSWTHYAYDATLIKPTSLSVSKRIFDGSYSSSTNHNTTTVSTTTIGDLLCTSGANTGDHCLNTAVDKNLAINVCTGSTCHAVTGGNVKVQAAGGGVSSGSGDSGGPVYAEGNIADFRGMNVSGTNSVSSGCTAYFGTPNCTNISYYVSGVGVLADYNAHIGM